MSWKTYIDNQALKGRIPPEWKAKIVSTAEEAIEEYKKDLLKEIDNILKEDIHFSDTILKILKIIK